MLRSATFDTMLSNCTHVEQILDLCGRALYDRYPSVFFTTGLADSGAAIRSRKINHWTGNNIIDENLFEEQVVVTFATQVDKAHKASVTPWLYVQVLGGDNDTPNGIFAA
ncbi:MAG: hypothetical protein QNJ33_12290 [Crocosphaera sp.]|nr:hypothetical protein [Crocosphaera sp.]